MLSYCSTHVLYNHHHNLRTVELEGNLWIIKSSPCQGGTVGNWIPKPLSYPAVPMKLWNSGSHKFLQLDGSNSVMKPRAISNNFGTQNLFAWLITPESHKTGIWRERMAECRKTPGLRHVMVILVWHRTSHSSASGGAARDDICNESGQFHASTEANINR